MSRMPCKKDCAEIARRRDASHTHALKLPNFLNLLVFDSDNKKLATRGATQYTPQLVTEIHELPFMATLGRWELRVPQQLTGPWVQT